MRPGLFPIMLNIRKIIRAFMSFSLGLMCIMCIIRFKLVLKDSKDNAFYEEIQTITTKKTPDDEYIWLDPHSFCTTEINYEQRK